MKEALKLALEALELHGKQYPHMVKGYCLDAITTIKEALAQPTSGDYALGYGEGFNDACKRQPEQEPIARVIDNGTPEGATEWIPFTNRVEPLKTGDLLYTQPDERNFCPRCGKRTADLTTIHTCTPPHDNVLQRGLSKTKEVVAGAGVFYGLPQFSVSASNAGGKCVTDGETSP